jgi:hypothetical protein
MGPTHVFSSGYGRVLTGASAVAAVAAGVSLTASDGAGALLVYGPWLLLVVLLVAATFWLPRVEVSDGGIEVRNVWSTVQVPWPTFRGVEAGFSLEVRSTAGRVQAWAAPRASGTAARLRRRRGEAEPAATQGTAAVVRHPGTADQAALVIAERYRALDRAGHLTGAARAVEAGEVRPTRRVHVRTLAAVAVLVVAGTAAAVLG